MKDWDCRCEKIKQEDRQQFLREVYNADNEEDENKPFYNPNVTIIEEVPEIYREYVKKYKRRDQFEDKCKIRRADIRARDNQECQLCYRTYNAKSFQFVIHHIDKNPFNENSDNLILLCRSCHRRIHSKKGIDEL
jgi:5-methylcytosine-specific restriction endonuclease McrA